MTKEKIPFPHIFFGIVTTAALAACQVGEKIGIVYPPPEGTETIPTEIAPIINNGDQVTPEEARDIMEKHMVDLSEYDDTLMIPDVFYKFFNDLSQEAFGRAFSYKLMLPGLVLSDGVELNYSAPWEQYNVTFKGAYLYVYQPFKNEPTNQFFPGELFPSQLVFRNKDGEIERIFVEPWDPESGEPPPF